jgi:hypothetical protein
MGGGLFGCFVCECEAEGLAISLFSVDCFGCFTSANFLFSRYLELVPISYPQQSHHHHLFLLVKLFHLVSDLVLIFSISNFITFNFSLRL